MSEVPLERRERKVQQMNVTLQGLLEIKGTHRPWGGPMLLGIALL